MDIFAIASWVLAALVGVTGVFPLTIPMLALAYKLRNGAGKIPLETESFWFRSGFSALGLFLLTLVTLVLNYQLVSRMDLPTGTVHLVLLLAYIPAGVVYLFWMYAMDEVLEGLSLFVLYVMMWGVPLLILDRVSPLKLIHRAYALLQPIVS